MALREFTDSQGIFWRAWDVQPTLDQAHDRRAQTDRRSPEPLLLRSGPDRRVTGDRRRMASGRVVPLREWLAFESATEKRRIIPIPKGWEQLADEELEILCGRAATVAKVTGL